MLLVAGFAQASDHIPVIVVTPAKFAQPLQQVGSSVVVLQGEELRDRGIDFIEDALQEIPSLIVTSQGARGSQVQLRVRGNEANHVLVLVDGIRVSNASTGEFDLSNLSLTAIDKIEVLLGPQSTLYGSDAIGGVINITTIRGGSGRSGQLALDQGERGIQSLQANINGGGQGWHYAVTLDDYQTDGISSAATSNGNLEKDPFSRQSAYIKSGFQAERIAASVIASSTRADFAFDGTDNATGQARDEALNNQQTEQDNLALLLQLPAADPRWHNQFQLSRASNLTDSITLDFGEYNTETDRLMLEYRGSFQLDDNNSLQYGLEQIDEELTTESISSFFTSVFDEDYTQSGLYLNWLHQYRDLNLSLGARVGDHDEFGRHDDYRLTASYQYRPAFRLRAAVGSGYKVPSLQELYGGFGGNPDLQPEQSRSAEIGLEYQAGGYQLSATFYDQDTTDLIRFQPITQFSGINENIGEAESRGVELTIKKNLDQISLSASFSKTDASETENGLTSDRIRVPEWSGNLLISYHRPDSRLWLQAVYRDQRRDIRFFTPDGINFVREDVILDSYTVWNLGASYQLEKDIKLSARIENLTDEDYEEVYSFGTRGRTAVVSAAWSF
ncbi:MAG: TonB-dependent receptor [Gammaproteobacteria bacterium]|nr:TonB-dependent receptor [Gammaproteobacteria bacterium]